MTTYASIKVSSVQFDPQTSSQVAPGSLYQDTLQPTGTLSSTDSGNSPTPVGATASGLAKTMQNTSGTTIPTNSPLAKTADGGIALAQADVDGDEILIGTSTSAIAPNAQSAVMLVGPNIPGILTGSGFAPGDPVYLNAVGGYTNDASTLDPTSESVIRLGYADCAAGAASTTVTDLIIFPAVVARPT